MTPIKAFNAAPASDARAALLACCGSRRWADALVAARPFASADALREACTKQWFSLPEADHLEAFAQHPRIGERVSPATDFLAHSSAEQADAQDTLVPLAESLLAGNRAYEEKFGFLYIVFASGRTAPELLDVLHARLEHTRDEELHEAARQQDRITQLRLQRWLQP